MIIGFAGKAASGKTTAANFLKGILPAPTLIVPMAMVLRDEVEGFLRRCGAGAYVPLVYGTQEDKVKTFALDTTRALGACPQWQDFIVEHCDIQEQPAATTVTVRRLLQWWGTEYRRAQDPDYWTKAWGRKVEKNDLQRTHILVDDVRFLNELHVVKVHAGLIVKIDRPGFAGANNHSSETSLDEYTGWDMVVNNCGTLEEFRKKIGRLAAVLHGSSRPD